MLSRLMTRREQLVLSVLAGAMILGSAALVALRFWRPTSPPTEPAPHGGRDASVSTLPTSETPPAAAPAAPAPALPEPPMSAVVSESASPGPESTPKDVKAAVIGEVHRPGLYTLAGSARVQELLRAAGGATEEADLSDINLAAPLIDGTTLVIPAQRASGMVQGRLVARRSQARATVNPPEYTISGWRPPRDAPVSASRDAEASTPAPTTDGAPAEDGLLNLNTATQDQLEALPGIGPKLAGEILRYREQTRYSTVDDLANVSGIGPKRLEAIRPLVTVR